MRMRLKGKKIALRLMLGNRRWKQDSVLTPVVRPDLRRLRLRRVDRPRERRLPVRGRSPSRQTQWSLVVRVVAVRVAVARRLLQLPEQLCEMPRPVKMLLPQVLWPLPLEERVALRHREALAQRAAREARLVDS
jgi:hypothetical protein